MYSGRSARPSISPVLLRPRLVLTDFLTSWKTSEKLKLLSRFSDISIFPEPLPAHWPAFSLLKLGNRLFKDWIFRNLLGGDVWATLARSGGESSVQSKSPFLSMNRSAREYPSTLQVHCEGEGYTTSMPSL